MINLIKSTTPNKPNNTGSCSSDTPQMELFPIKGKRVEASFSGEQISSNGGALLLREVEKRTGILKEMASVITDNRDRKYVKHKVFEIICQRVFQIACGYEDTNDCNELKSDKIMKMCAGRLPESEADLGSQSTMCRFENSVNRGDLYRIAEVFITQFVASYGRNAPKVIILDCDDTNHNCHGNQQLSLFNTYYKEHCLMPLHIYEGFSGKLITTILKPGRRAKGICIFAILRRIIGFLRKHWKKTQIIVRGDSHFCSPELMDWTWERDRMSFVTGLTGNSKLNKLAASTVDAAKAIYLKTGQKVKLYTEFSYQAGTWKHPQRVVAKVEYSEKGANLRFVVTDFKKCTRKHLYEKVYCARGKMELYIKDHKTYMKSDKSSCNSFEANQLRLFLHSAAYVLIHTLQKEVLKGTRFATATMKTIQLKVLKIAAKVKELKHKIKIVLPACTPEKVSIGKGFEIFRILGW